MMSSSVQRRRQIMVSVLLAVGATLLAAGPVVIFLDYPESGHAQPRLATARPAFEVVSVKPNKSGELLPIVTPPSGGRFSATNVPLKLMIMFAYNKSDFQIARAPDWFTADRFDIVANSDGNPTRDALRAMLQTLLEDRFRLKVHRETKELPVYSVSVSSPGKIHESQGDCNPTPIPSPSSPTQSKLLPALCGQIAAFPGHANGQKVTLAQLVDALSLVSGRIVMDKTGLLGKYDINLEWAPAELQLRTPSTGGAAAGPLPNSPALQFPAVDPNGPSLSTALKEQLGLKLESTKGPVEILVIDRAEKPSEN